MSVMVRIPTPLRRMTNGKDKVEMQSGNLGDLVEKLDGEYPGFKDRLIDENGDLRYFVNIYLNGEDVRFLDGLDTTTNSGDEVSIVPAVAGGDAPPAGGHQLKHTETTEVRVSASVALLFLRMIVWKARWSIS